MVKRNIRIIEFAVHVAGFALGCYWFGIWFLVPAILMTLSVKVTK